MTSKERFKILKRDGFACRYCGAEAPSVKLQVDHIIPQSRGGSDDPANLVASCEECNRGKGDDPISWNGVRSKPFEKQAVYESIRAGGIPFDLPFPVVEQAVNELIEEGRIKLYRWTEKTGRDRRQPILAAVE